MTMDKYSTFMAYNTALKMLSEITDKEIQQLPEDLREFFNSELAKQASRYEGATA